MDGTVHEGGQSWGRAAVIFIGLGILGVLAFLFYVRGMGYFSDVPELVRAPMFDSLLVRLLFRLVIFVGALAIVKSLHTGIY